MNAPVTEPETRIWGTIKCPEPPPCRFEYSEMLAIAKAMLASRENAFPGEIAVGRLTVDDAENHLRTFRHLIDDLTWIIATRRGEVTGRNTLSPLQRSAICQQLDGAINNLSGILKKDRVLTLSQKYNDQAHALIALRWNYDPARLDEFGRLQIHANATLNQTIRQQQNSQQPMSERKAA